MYYDIATVFSWFLFRQGCREGRKKVYSGGGETALYEKQGRGIHKRSSSLCLAGTTVYVFSPRFCRIRWPKLDWRRFSLEQSGRSRRGTSSLHL